MVGLMLLLALSGLLTGCQRLAVKLETASIAQPNLSGDVNSDRIEPDPSTRMQLTANQIFIPGDSANKHEMPVYPAGLLRQQLPNQLICLRFAANVDGTVSNLTPLYGVDECPANAGQTPPEFWAATVDAVSRWEFFASIRCTFPAGTPDREKCDGPGAKQEAVGVTLSYRFVFSSDGGRGGVKQFEVKH
jgi:hypothetical protein